MAEPTTPAAEEAPTVKHAAVDGPTGAAATGLQDRVVMASRHADGTPAQSADFEFIGDKDAVLAGATHQHVSIALAALQTSSDPDVNPTFDEQEAVIPAAEARAEQEVNERHKGAFA